jgi:hypothetical protein
MARGGKREGAGRPAAATTKVGRELKAAAQEYTEDALAVLASIMNAKEEPAAARVSAANAILDRGHGKPKQAIDVDANVKATVEAIRRTIVDPRHPNG